MCARQYPASARSLVRAECMCLSGIMEALYCELHAGERGSEPVFIAL